MELTFWKMHGLGNDYLYFDRRHGLTDSPDWPRVAQRLCDRHFGVGADGIITIGSAPGVDAVMRIFNADGSESEMCGNGLRALAKWLYDRRLAGPSQVIQTGAGLLYPEIIAEDQGYARQIRVNMGIPVFDARNLGGALADQEIGIDDVSVRVSAVSMGNPHLMVFGPLWSQKEMMHWGPLLEHHPRFPDRINVHSVQVIETDHMVMRHWERGAGLTMACGTGVSGAAALAIKKGLVVSPVTVTVPGGTLLAEWQGEGTAVYLTGPADEVFRGVYRWH